MAIQKIKIFGSNKCQNCGIEYSRSETIRKYGNMWWTGIYCTPQCMTKSIIESKENKNEKNR